MRWLIVLANLMVPIAASASVGLGLNVETYGAVAGDSLDDCAAFQAAHDAADTLPGVPPIMIPAGNWILSCQTLTLKTRMVGAGPGRTKIMWHGVAGGTAMTVPNGKTSFGGLQDLEFRVGSAMPGTWLDTTADSVDKHFILNNIKFQGASDDAIKVGNWYNLHWRDLRFDRITGGYALRATNTRSLHKPSFLIDGFTYDHGSQCDDCGGAGVLLFDNTANASNLGIATLAHGRIEINEPWGVGTPRAIIHVKKAAKGAHPRTLAVVLQDVTYDKTAAGAMVNDVVHYLEGGGGRECLAFRGFRGNPAAYFGGAWTATGFQAPSAGGVLFTHYGCD